MKPGTRIVSNSFTMDDWQADETTTVGGRLHDVVHRLSVDRAGQGRGHLAARCQHAHPHPGVPGARRHHGTTPITSGKLKGEDITFAANGVTYTGKVNGTSMKGTTSAGRELERYEESSKKALGSGLRALGLAGQTRHDSGPLN
jgi:hypothetical protein